MFALIGNFLDTVDRGRNSRSVSTADFAEGSFYFR